MKRSGYLILSFVLFLIFFSGCSFFSSSSKDKAAASALGVGRKNYQTDTSRLGNVAKARGALLWPVSGKISSRFGRRGLRFHEGVDISAPKGTPIYAAHSGTVIYSGSGINGYGNVIAIKSNFGLVTIYGHNSSNAVHFKDEVNIGDLIGYVGSTGHATGNHLHFETRVFQPGRGLVAFDPLYFFKKP